MYRAIYKRCDGVQDLPEGYISHCPLLSSITNIETREPRKATVLSVNWLAHDPSLEVINSGHGKKDKMIVSRLCKNQLFRMFISVWNRMPPQTRCSDSVPEVYKDAKRAVISYQFAKERLYSLFQRTALGTWLTKPEEQDLFSIEEAPNNGISAK